MKVEDYKIHVYWVVGDHDAVLVLLLIPRLLWKAEILLSQVRDKFPPVEKIERIAVVRDHAVEQFAFKSRLGHYVYSLQVCTLFVYTFLTTHFTRAQWSLYVLGFQTFVLTHFNSVENLL